MEEKLLPAGFRFHPTDEELITYYLLRKVFDSTFTSKAVAVVDFNKSEPWDLPGNEEGMGEKERYFFSMKDRKYPTGLRTNRATQSGYWKTTGKDKEICGSGSGVLIGMKKTLVFYKGRAPRGDKTNWVMHEYRLIHNNHPFKSSKEEWVVCRVFHKSSSAPKKPQESIIISSSSSPQQSQDSASMVNEFGDAELLLPHSSSSSCGGFSNHHLAGQSYNNNFVGEYHNSSSNVNTSSIMNLMTMTNNWALSSATNENIIPSSSSIPSLPWPSGLLLNNPMNSLLLKALQLRTYHQQIREAGAAAAHTNNNNHLATFNHIIPHHGFPQLIGTDLNNLNSVSASRALECFLSQPQQPFNMAPL